MKFTKTLGITFFLILISGCNEYEKMMAPALKIKLADKNSNPVFDGEIEPPIPNRSENEKTVLGIDSNNNGIRDDIDIWINRTALDYNERMAMRQYAKAKQVLLKSCKEKIQGGIKDMSNKWANAVQCLEYVNYSKHKDKKKRQNELDLFFGNFEANECWEYFNKNSTSVVFKNFQTPWLNCNFSVKD